MTGTVGKYCSAIIRRENNIAFELLNRMEKRFNLHKLVATLKVQFNNARQSENADIDEWADRLLALADKACRDLPDIGADDVCLLKCVDIFTFELSGPCRVAR
jgi:hypothetical protein